MKTSTSPKIDVSTIKKLREETGAPIIRVKKVLEEFEGDEVRALEVLRKEGFEKAEKRVERATSQGKVFSYVHHTGKVAALVELMCETDFVAKTEVFESLGKDLCLQVASIEVKDSEHLLTQEFIKDPSKKIHDLVKEVIAKTGENVRVGRVVRVELGK